jgi:hypothetical protein
MRSIIEEYLLTNYKYYNLDFNTMLKIYNNVESMRFIIETNIRKKITSRSKYDKIEDFIKNVLRAGDTSLINV